MEQNNSEPKRGRGRPRGSTGSKSSFSSYNPKRWLPWMDSLVMAKIAGGTSVSNEELGERYGISKEHVSNILCTEQAQSIRDTVRRSLLAGSQELTDRLAKIRNQSLKRIEDVLSNETLATNSPLAIADRAVRFFEMTFPKDKSNQEQQAQNVVNINGNVLVANPEYMNRLNTAMELSNQIEERRLLKEKEVLVEEKKPLKLVANS